MSEKKSKECPKCGGTGEVDRDVGVFLNPLLCVVGLDEKECPMCKGKGHVEVWE